MEVSLSKSAAKLYIALDPKYSSRRVTMATFGTSTMYNATQFIYC